MTIRLIQVGLGGAGRHWLKNVLPSHQEAVEVVALVDADPQALTNAQAHTTLASKYFFTDLSSALAAVPCDAVLIVTTLPAHVPLALQALNAGKHVLMEKPFAPSLSEAQQVVEAAEQNQRILLISQNYRYYPAVRAVKAFLQEEQLGPVGQINLNFRSYVKPSEHNRHFTLWQPLLIDMAIHHFDLMRYILQREPRCVSCFAWNPAWSAFTDPAAASACILFQDNVVVNYYGNWTSTGPITTWSGEWRVECERGEIRWSSRGDTSDEVIIHPLGEGPSMLELPAMAMDTDWHGSLNAFVKAIASGQEPESSGRNNLPTLALALAAVEAAQTHLPVEIASLLPGQECV